MEEIRGKSILIVGYGREGKSVEQFLKTRHPAVSIDVTDQKDGKEYLGNIEKYDTAIRSPGVPGRLLKKAKWVTSATNVFFSTCNGITIGITGTKGKSTTASLIAHMLNGSRLVGNIGRPVLNYLQGSTKKTVFVIELSSHQLEDCRYSPHIAVLLPIVPEHLDYYENFSAYSQAKSNIVKFQKKDDVVFYHPSIEKIANLSPGKKFPIIVSKTKSPLVGNHINISAAISVAKYFGLSEESIKKSLGTFTALPHRLEFVGEFRKIRFYNDSLATIPEATIHALESLPKVDTLIAGGFDRGLDYSKLREYLKNHPVKTLILFPDTGKKIGKGFWVQSMEEAVKLAYKHTPPGKICLLSPASASFNLFHDYADRGNQFKEWVKKLGK